MTLSVKGEAKRRRRDVKEYVNPLTIQKITVTNGSDTSLNKVMINESLDMNGDSVLSGSFDYSTGLTIEVKWRLNEMPKISNDFISNKVSQSIVLSFDGQSIDGREDDYESFLFDKKFELIKINKDVRCENWLLIVSFNSPNVPLFGEKSVFDVNCSDGSLVIHGVRHVVDKDKGGGAMETSWEQVQLFA